jgi:Polyketide cyclase / dehydrase and lipid transport
MSSSRTYPASVEHAFDTVLALPLEQVFDRRYGAIPAVRGTECADRTWGLVGQVRTVRLAGGGSMREELTHVDRPHAFGYTLSDVTGPMKPLASQVLGLWSFDPAGTGARITWQWTLARRSALAAPVLPIFARLWRGYARQSLAHIEELLLPA